VRFYFDTAYVAKCYLNEPDGKKVRKLARRADGLYSSSLCIAELACVFQRHVREGSITPDEAASLRRIFLEDIRNGVWVLFPVSERLLYQIELLVGGLPPTAYLRAGDAIHLVSAKDAGFQEIWTSDRRLLQAAQYFDLVGKNL
jgi:predicted nucleic acid-binding protein